MFAAGLIWQMLDSYYITALFSLSMIKNRQVESASISKRIQWFGESLYEEQTIPYFESCNQESFKNAIQALLDMKVLQRASVFLQLTKEYKRNEKKLQDLVDLIGSYRVVSDVNSVLNKNQSKDKGTNNALQSETVKTDGKQSGKKEKDKLPYGVRRNVMVDFPFMAKL